MIDKPESKLIDGKMSDTTALGTTLTALVTPEPEPKKSKKPSKKSKSKSNCTSGAEASETAVAKSATLEPESSPKPELKAKSKSKPSDSSDIEALWEDPKLGDALTDANLQSIIVDKPKTYFRVHPDPAYRRRTEAYVHKIEGEIGTTLYVLGPKMKGMLEEARPCLLVTCIYRNGTPRLWPIMLPREGERDNAAWSSARSSARTALDKWVKLVWVGGSYQTRDAQPGYAPDPAWEKLPPYNDLVTLGLGPHGVIRDTNHPIYRELMGVPTSSNNEDDDEL